MAVTEPVKLVITNYPEGQCEEFEVPNNPRNEEAGNRKVPFTRELYIEKSDFAEVPPRSSNVSSRTAKVRRRRRIWSVYPDSASATSLPSTLGSWSKGRRLLLLLHQGRAEADRSTAKLGAKPISITKCLHNVSLEEAAPHCRGRPYVIRQNVPTTGKASFDDMLYGHVEVDCDTLDDNVLLSYGRSADLQLR